MLQAFLKYLDQENLLTPGQKVLLAVSGGIDSMVMADLFSKTEFDFGVVHCNFGLRGKDSDEDETFVSAWTARHQKAFFTRRFDLRPLLDAGKSVQMAARELRYAWFQELLREYDYDSIATAHHANDSIETFLFNLTKGTGLKGLRGIMPRQDSIIRPLLFASRQQIQSYAQDHAIQWREDVSNAGTKYSRNLIRHKAVPILQSINPSLEATFLNTHKRIRAADQLLSEYIEMIKANVCRETEEGLDIDVEKLMAHTYPQAVLWELIYPFGFMFDQLENIMMVLQKGLSGKKFFSPGFVLYTDRGMMILRKRMPKEDVYIEILQPGQEVFTGKYQVRTELIDAENFVKPKSNYIAMLNAEKLIWPLILRTWKKGDTFKPLGMKGHKKVSDFLIDNKVPLHKKSGIMVVQSGGDIIWLAGYRPDDRYKVKEKTRKIVKLEIHQPYDKSI
ncbi:MAG: tRNA lysidine(34) synthetase TilS [Cyclobacteriaceae bacterium]|nr:tRNA lysidine(34) synthetase TilS [Cyclobacteriaceae bacterium]